MKKLFTLASMMVVLAVSAQQSRIDKKGPQPIELKHTKQDSNKHKHPLKPTPTIKDKKEHINNKKIKKQQEKLVLQKIQHHNKQEHLKRQKEVAYHPIKMR